MTHSTARQRLLTLLALAVVPWTVVFIRGEVTLFFPFGVVNTNPLAFADILTLFSRGWGLPRNPDLLPLSYVFYTLALASAVAGLFDREPTRLTAGLLVLAGLTHLGVAYSVVHRLGYTPVPFGAVLLVAAAWWFYWPDLRSVLFAPEGAEVE
jgi:uncharacterized protein (TIGR04206 family)